MIKGIEGHKMREAINHRENVFVSSFAGASIPGVSKKYPLLTGNRNETMRYHYSPSGQLNLSVFNLDPHTLHLKIGHQTLEIQACKVKIYSAPETRGFVKGPSHDLLSSLFCSFLFKTHLHTHFSSLQYTDFCLH